MNINEKESMYIAWKLVNIVKYTVVKMEVLLRLKYQNADEERRQQSIDAFCKHGGMNLLNVRFLTDDHRTMRFMKKRIHRMYRLAVKQYMKSLEEFDGLDISDIVPGKSPWTFEDLVYKDTAGLLAVLP